MKKIFLKFLTLAFLVLFLTGCAQVMSIPVMVLSLPVQILKMAVSLLPVAAKYAPYALLFLSNEEGNFIDFDNNENIIKKVNLQNNVSCILFKIDENADIVKTFPLNWAGALVLSDSIPSKEDLENMKNYIFGNNIRFAVTSSIAEKVYRM